MLRVTTVWSGFPGSPGYTNFFFSAFSDTDAVLNAVTDFWTALQPVFATRQTFSIVQPVDVVSVPDGLINGSENGTTFHPPIIGGTNNSLGPAPAGACIDWATDDVINGHRVRGRTFLVPLVLGAFQDDGTLSSSSLTTINDAAVGLANDSVAGFGVYHRPVAGAGGSFHAVSAAGCRDKVAVLTSRRD